MMQDNTGHANGDVAADEAADKSAWRAAGRAVIGAAHGTEGTLLGGGDRVEQVQ